jgi:hypothetical protein
VVVQPTLPGFSGPEDDRELRAVADELLALDPQGIRVASVLRRTYDMLQGEDWVVARPTDPAELAPLLPDIHE